MQQLSIRKAVMVPALLGSLAALHLSAQEAEGPLNRFNFAYRAGFNISASFRDIGGITAQNYPGLAVAGVNHNYDDGYNRVDISGNANRQTWYWGYQNASQVPGDGNIYMHSVVSSGEPTFNDVGDDPLHGAELTYNRHLGKIGRVSWGLEAAANYTSIDIEDSSTLPGSISLITDRYSLGGIVAPQPPYFGTYQGPNPDLGEPNRPVISDIPNRTTERATTASRYALSGDIYGFRLGPYFEFPFHPHFSASLSGGFAMAVVDNEFSYQETITGAGLGKSVSRSGKDSKDDFLFGGYVGANLVYKANRHLSFFAGVQYQNIGTFSQTANAKESELDLSKSIFLTAGCGISF